MAYRVDPEIAHSQASSNVHGIANGPRDFRQCIPGRSNLLGPASPYVAEAEVIDLGVAMLLEMAQPSQP